MTPLQLAQMHWKKGTRLESEVFKEYHYEFVKWSEDPSIAIVNKISRTTKARTAGCFMWYGYLKEA